MSDGQGPEEPRQSLNVPGLFESLADGRHLGCTEAERGQGKHGTGREYRVSLSTAATTIATTTTANMLRHGLLLLLVVIGVIGVVWVLMVVVVGIMWR